MIRQMKWRGVALAMLTTLACGDGPHGDLDENNGLMDQVRRGATRIAVRLKEAAWFSKGMADPALYEKITMTHLPKIDSAEAAPEEGQGLPLSFMSFNIWKPTSKGDGIKQPSCIERHRKILETIRASRPDVLLLQEVAKNVLEEILMHTRDLQFQFDPKQSRWLNKKPCQEDCEDCDKSLKQDLDSKFHLDYTLLTFTTHGKDWWSFFRKQGFGYIANGQAIFIRTELLFLTKTKILKGMVEYEVHEHKYWEKENKGEDDFNSTPIVVLTYMDSSTNEKRRLAIANVHLQHTDMHHKYTAGVKGRMMRTFSGYHDPEHVNAINKKIAELNPDKIIIGGDWNNPLVIVPDRYMDAGTEMKNESDTAPMGRLDHFVMSKNIALKEYENLYFDKNMKHLTGVWEKDVENQCGSDHLPIMVFAEI